MDTIDTGALIPSVAIDQILAERDAMVRSAEQVAAALAAAPAGFPGLYFDSGRCRWSTSNEFAVDRVRQIADRHGWERLIAETGLWTFMDSKAREEWNEQIENGKFPPLTAESAEDTIRSIHQSRGSMVARGVQRCFAGLGAYKTNRPDRFDRRMVLRGVVGWWGHIGTGADVLDDLNRAIHLMRGLPEPDHRQGAWIVLQAARSSTDTKGRLSSSFVATFSFFSVHVFKNGNGHVTFDHQTDIDSLNRVLAYSSRGQIPDHERRKR